MNKQYGKLVKKEREIINTVAIANWCNAQKIRYELINNWQIRIYANNTIDVFTQSKKYHNITKNKRGVINGKIIAFLEYFV